MVQDRVGRGGGAIAPGDPQDKGVSSYALLVTPEDVGATAILSHFHGNFRRPLIDRRGDRMVFAGDASRVDTSAVILTSFADVPRAATIEVRGDNGYERTLRVEVPARGHSGPMVDLTPIDGQATITVTGKDIACSLMRWNNDGTLVD